MNEINRGVIVVKPRLPFLEWVNSTGDDDMVLTLEEATRDSTAYLTPEIEDGTASFAAGRRGVRQRAVLRP